MRDLCLDEMALSSEAVVAFAQALPPACAPRLERLSMRQSRLSEKAYAALGAALATRSFAALRCLDLESNKTTIDDIHPAQAATRAFSTERRVPLADQLLTPLPFHALPLLEDLRLGGAALSNVGARVLIGAQAAEQAAEQAAAAADRLQRKVHAQVKARGAGFERKYSYAHENASAMTTDKRPQLGDTVTIVDGDYRVAKTGEIIQDDRDEQPFEVKFSDGDTHWFKEAEVFSPVSTAKAVGTTTIGLPFMVGLMTAGLTPTWLEHKKPPAESEPPLPRPPPPSPASVPQRSHQPLSSLRRLTVSIARTASDPSGAGNAVRRASIVELLETFGDTYGTLQELVSNPLGCRATGWAAGRLRRVTVW